MDRCSLYVSRSGLDRSWFVGKGTNRHSKRRRAGISGARVKEWTISMNRNSVALSFVWPIVPYRKVLEAAVVPESYVILLPPKPDLKLRSFDVLKQSAENPIALFAFDAVNPCSKRAVDVEARPAGLRVGSDHRVYRGRVNGFGIIDATVGVSPSVDVFRFVNRR